MRTLLRPLLAILTIPPILMKRFKEPRRQNTRRQRQQRHTRDGKEPAQEFAERRDRNHVAIAYSGERGDAPPHGRRNAAELIGLSIMLRVKHDEGNDGEDKQYKEKAEHKL